MENIFNTNLSFLIKLSSIFMFIIIFIYCLFNEYKKRSESTILTLVDIEQEKNKTINQQFADVAIGLEKKEIADLGEIETKAIKDIEDASKDLEKSLDIEEKSKFIGSYFSEYYSNLDLTSQMAISVLVLNQAMLSALSTIVFIYYGDILIRRLNLEVRWPRLAKLINLRRKFQSYYFFISILIIASISVGEILICIKVLTS